MSLRKLIWKEVYATLKNPQIVISIVMIPVMFMAMGGIISAGVQVAKQEIIGMKIALIDNDDTWLTRNVTSILKNKLSNRLILINQTEYLELSRMVKRYGATVVIPKGFTKNIIANLTSRLEAYVQLATFSVPSMSKVSIVNDIAREVSDTVKEVLAKNVGVSIELFKINVGVDSLVFLGNLTFKSGEVRTVISMLSSTGFIIGMMVALVLQFATLNMAQEKEEKTFEVLLSQPVSRTEIGVAKMIGAVILSIIEVVVFSASWMYYIRSITGGASESSTQSLGSGLGLLINRLGIDGLVLTLTDLFIIMLCASVLGLILGGLSRDTKSAGMFVGPIWFIVVFIGLGMQFFGLPNIPTKLLAYSATLILGPAVIAYSALLGMRYVMSYTILVNVLEFLVLLYILKRFMESEVIVIGWRPPKRIAR